MHYIALLVSILQLVGCADVKEENSRVKAVQQQVAVQGETKLRFIIQPASTSRSNNSKTISAYTTTRYYVKDTNKKVMEPSTIYVPMSCESIEDTSLRKNTDLVLNCNGVKLNFGVPEETYIGWQFNNHYIRTQETLKPLKNLETQQVYRTSVK